MDPALVELPATVVEVVGAIDTVGVTLGVVGITVDVVPTLEAHITGPMGVGP